jgi:pimeloyl-ACP methyl ester carboxylesterase
MKNTFNCVWTQSKARLQLMKSTTKYNLNWLFLPGGPGLGSESLSDLTKLLTLPGSLWHLDLPGDGSNCFDQASFANWQTALVEAVGALPNPVLVGHSTGGMYALATPALKNYLSGLVLISSAPDTSWRKQYFEFCKNYPIIDANKIAAKYAKYPNNTLLRQLTIASAAHCFSDNSLKKGLKLLSSLPYNHESCDWSGAHFDETYKAKWIPKTLPTLILTGENDNIIPIHYFKNDKRFQRDNISIKIIKKAGHFPWIDNPNQVHELFSKYAKRVM